MTSMDYTTHKNLFDASIASIGNANDIETIVSSYNNAQVNFNLMKSDGYELSLSDSVFQTTLNHLTNYNIVRVAGLYYDRLGKDLTSESAKALFGLCLESVKEHPSNHIEIELIENLINELS